MKNGGIFIIKIKFNINYSRFHKDGIKVKLEGIDFFVSDDNEHVPDKCRVLFAIPISDE